MLLASVRVFRRVKTWFEIMTYPRFGLLLQYLGYLRGVRLSITYLHFYRFCNLILEALLCFLFPMTACYNLLGQEYEVVCVREVFITADYRHGKDGESIRRFPLVNQGSTDPTQPRRARIKILLRHKFFWLFHLWKLNKIWGFV